MADLVFTDGDRVVFRVPLNKHRFTVGPLARDDLQLPSDQLGGVSFSVERRAEGGHQLVTRGDAALKVNGRTAKTRTLVHGDTVALSSMVATYMEPENGGHGTAPMAQGKVAEVGARAFLERNGKRTIITEVGLVVGANPDHSFPLPEDGVSWNHALVFHKNGVTTVRDEGSRNGTYVRGVRVMEAQVENGDTLRFAQSEFTVVTVANQAHDGAGKVRPIKRTGSLVHADAAMDEVARLIQVMAPASADVLIMGESGTGKELVANALHTLGRGAHERMLTFNCAAVQPSLFESELFGHVRGAFTGALQNRVGLLEAVGAGTLFMDEVGELSLENQAKLLRTLENREIQPVGGEPKKFRCRLVFATLHDLPARVAKKTFREDLYFRMNTLCITLPPLRQRRGDIAVLARHLLDTLGHNQVTLTADAVRALEDYPWPGNVRQLHHVLVKMTTVHERMKQPGPHTFVASDIPFDPLPPAGAAPGDRASWERDWTMEDAKTEAAHRAFAEFKTVAATATHLGISTNTLRELLKKPRP